MKKLIVIALAGMVAITQADFYVSFTTAFGFSSNYAGDPSGNTPLLMNFGDQATVQLIYAGANGVADFDSVVGSTYSLNSVGGVAGDDLVLTTFLTAANTQDFITDYAYFNADVDAAYLGGGQIYGRIFDAAGQYFYQGHIQVANNKNPAAIPAPVRDVYDLGQSDFAFAGLQPNGNVYQVIPEPATFGLMGIAGLGMFLARKKTRR